MKKIYFSIAFLSLGLIGFTQASGGKIKKATKSFKSYSYNKAIEKYLDAEDNSIESRRNLATSYYKTGKIQLAEEMFAEIVNLDGATSEDVYTYATILQENKKYDQADDWMAKFNALSSGDSRGVAYVQNKGAYVELQKDKGQFTVKNLEVNSEQEDFSPVYFGDKVLFSSSREGVKPIRRKWNWNNLPFLDLYITDKGEDLELSNPNVFQKKINKKYHEGPVCFNSDETKMVFTRNNYKGKSLDGTVKLQLFTSNLNEKGDWTKPQSFPLNSNEYSVGHASLSQDGKWMYFASDMPGGIGGVDIYKIEIKDDGSYGIAINLGDKINTEGNEMFPSINKEGMLFFSSNGLVGLGGLDVFVAQIKEDLSIGKVLNVGVPINSNRDDFSFILDNETKSGYFASNREGGKGDDDIYSFNLLKPFTFDKAIKGTVRDLKTNEPIADAKVYFETITGVIVDSTLTDNKGEYEFLVDNVSSLKIKVLSGDYFAKMKSIEKEELIEEEFVLDFNLEKDPGLSLYAVVTDNKTKEPLSGVLVTLVDNLSGKLETYTTEETGDYLKSLITKKLNDRGSYNFTLQREGYFTKTITYNVEFDHVGQYDVHVALDMSMDPLVEDLALMIVINPINFDFNKFNIRPDAAVELDKIIEVMNKYPGMVIELGAHTDCRGSDSYNEKLSDRRAKASAEYIATRITNPERIYGKGYGEKRPLEDCSSNCNECTDEQHDKNRRTEFKVIKTGNEDVKINNTSSDSFDH